MLSIAPRQNIRFPQGFNAEDKCLFRNSLFNSWENLIEKGIYVDQETNTIHMLGDRALSYWRDTQVINQKNQKNQSLRFFPSSSYIIQVNNSKPGQGNRSYADLRRIFQSLGFNVIETELEDSANEDVREILRSRASRLCGVKEKDDKNFKNEIAKLIFVNHLRSQGIKNIQIIDIYKQANKTGRPRHAIYYEQEGKAHYAFVRFLPSKNSKEAMEHLALSEIKELKGSQDFDSTNLLI